MNELLKRVEELRRLKNGWNGENSKFFSDAAIQSGIKWAKEIITRFPEVDQNYIQVIPSIGDEIHFEFKLNNALVFIVANS